MFDFVHVFRPEQQEDCNGFAKWPEKRTYMGFEHFNFAFFQRKRRFKERFNASG